MKTEPKEEQKVMRVNPSPMSPASYSEYLSLSSGRSPAADTLNSRIDALESIILAHYKTGAVNDDFFSSKIWKRLDRAAQQAFTAITGMGREAYYEYAEFCISNEIWKGSLDKWMGLSS